MCFVPLIEAEGHDTPSLVQCLPAERDAQLPPGDQQAYWKKVLVGLEGKSQRAPLVSARDRSREKDVKVNLPL